MTSKHKPEFLKPATWPHADDGYGRSPALAALPALRAKEIAIKHALHLIDAEVIRVISDEELRAEQERIKRLFLLPPLNCKDASSG
jgi:hypothetical protein